MIISASRRTDIPAFYCDWFFNRLSDGFVLVRNPMNARQISKISLSPSVVDGIVFWTKNPSRIMKRLASLSEYNYYFQFTLTPYDQQLEPNLPPKETLLSTFKSLSEMLGKSRVIWRYDPIIVTPKYSLDYHFYSFESYAAYLSKYTRKCVISFVDLYKKSKKNLFEIELVELSMSQMSQIARTFSDIAKKYSIELVSCAEELDLTEYGIDHGKCIDDKLISEIADYTLDIDKDKTQRKECGCVASIDIGAYNTCSHGCLYCYANFDNNVVKKNLSMHDSRSPLLFGQVGPMDRISERKVFSCRNVRQKSKKDKEPRLFS